MVWIDPEFVGATIPEDEQYEGTEVDANVLKGCTLERPSPSPPSPYDFTLSRLHAPGCPKR